MNFYEQFLTFGLAYALEERTGDEDLV
jgi:hypothetical protein